MQQETILQAHESFVTPLVMQHQHHISPSLFADGEENKKGWREGPQRREELSVETEQLRPAVLISADIHLPLAGKGEGSWGRTGPGESM